MSLYMFSIFCCLLLIQTAAKNGTISIEGVTEKNIDETSKMAVNASNVQSSEDGAEAGLVAKVASQTAFSTNADDAKPLIAKDASDVQSSEDGVELNKVATVASETEFSTNADGAKSPIAEDASDVQYSEDGGELNHVATVASNVVDTSDLKDKHISGAKKGTLSSSNPMVVSKVHEMSTFLKLSSKISSKKEKGKGLNSGGKTKNKKMGSGSAGKDYIEHHVKEVLDEAYTEPLNNESLMLDGVSAAIISASMTIVLCIMKIL